MHSGSTTESRVTATFKTIDSGMHLSFHINSATSINFVVPACLRKFAEELASSLS